MNHQIRRYVFIDYENLKKIKFKKLEKVCDKVFICISSEEDMIPFMLVQQIQKLGKNVKWITVDTATESDVNYHICFLMGKLHEKIGKDIEFAVLSNDAGFDPLVQFINNDGRSCLRVKRQSAKAFEEGSTIESEFHQYPSNGERQTEALEDSAITDSIIEETARETVRRLIRSGNRPAEVATLKNYILLHNQELSVHGNIEKIIKRLVETNEIHVHEGEVIYNF